MNIFILPGVFPCEENMQLGIFVYDQCEELQARGHRLTILDCTEYRYDNWNKCNKINKTKVGVFENTYSNHVKGLAQSRLPRRSVWEYKKNLNKTFKRAVSEQGMPDVIYAHFAFPCGMAAVDIGRRYNIPVVIQEHYSMYLKNKLPRYTIKKTKEAINAAASYFCVSESLGNSIARLTGCRDIKVIPNMVNRKYKCCEMPENGRYIFFSAGNFYENKRLDLLIEAFCASFDKDENVELRIGGDGLLFDRLRKKVEAAGRTAQIKLLGRLDSDGMFEQYKQCNCFVLFSEYETFGIVYREAMAVGRPVISTKNGGIDEQWSDILGILVDRNDLKQSIQALKTMYVSRQYDPQRISDHCLSRYSASIIIDKVERELTEAVKEHKRKDT